MYGVMYDGFSFPDLCLELIATGHRLPATGRPRIFLAGSRQPVAGSARRALAHADNLVGLHTQPPARVSHAVLDCEAGILLCTGPVHRLEIEMVEVE
jgi:hypothetical protein